MATEAADTPRRAWPVFRSLAAFRASDLPGDLIAGLTLAAIAIPEQMATARLGGFSPQIGFFAFIAGSLGFAALAQFIHGYIAPVTKAQGEVLYVEDSKVVALATRRMLEKYGLKVNHVTSVEDALAMVETARAVSRPPADIVLTDVYLKGGLTGKELLETLRGEMGYTRGNLPVLVMTADDNPKNQSALLRAGANDLVHKPVEERLLITKLLFQLRVALNQRQTEAARQAASTA
jgi:CheY-like chemotaxis protein